METAVVGLRWIAVLPGAVLAGSLARLVVGLLNWLTMPVYEAHSILGQFGIGFLMGGAFVAALAWSGARIAPSHKNTTGIVLAALFLLIASISAGLVFSGAATSVQLSDPRALGEFVGGPVVGVATVVTAWRGELD